MGSVIWARLVEAERERQPSLSWGRDGNRAVLGTPGQRRPGFQAPSALALVTSCVTFSERIAHWAPRCLHPNTSIVRAVPSFLCGPRERCRAWSKRSAVTTHMVSTRTLTQEAHRPQAAGEPPEAVLMV